MIQCQSLHKAVFLLLIKDKSAFDTLTAIIDKEWVIGLMRLLIFLLFKNNSKPFFQLRLVEALAPILSEIICETFSRKFS